MLDKNNNPAFQAYMRDVNKHPLISVEREHELATRIKATKTVHPDKSITIGDHPALEELILANLRLVVTIATKYLFFGLDILELVAAGNDGLRKAAERFEPGHGAKFSTYASFWIKQALCRETVYCGIRTIRLPVHMHSKVARLYALKATMAEEFGREPTHEELAENLGISVKKIFTLLSAASAVTSLDAVNGDGGSLADTIASPDTEPFSMEHIENSESWGMIHEILDQIPVRERDIIVRRFGLFNHDPHTLDQIGVIYKLTRERIRQIQTDAMARIRTAINRRSQIGV